MTRQAAVQEMQAATQAKQQAAATVRAAGGGGGGGLREGWSEVPDGQGGTYYANPTTGETSWEKPAGFTSGGFVAVIAAKAGYHEAGKKPLCEKCFDRDTPLWKSKLLWLLALLAIAGPLAALILSLSPCKMKFTKDVRIRTTNKTTVEEVRSNVSVTLYSSENVTQNVTYNGAHARKQRSQANS